MTAKERLVRVLSTVIYPKIGVRYEEVVADFLLDNDVVPVVRCKDCKHRGSDECVMHIVVTESNEEFLKLVDNDFCSYGERKNEVSG